MGCRKLLLVFSLLPLPVWGASPEAILKGLDIYCIGLLRATNGNVRKALDYIDGKIAVRLGPVKVDLNEETPETVLRAADLAAYLGSKGGDPLEQQILEDARKKGIRIELSNASVADEKTNRVWIDRAAVRSGGTDLKKVVRHELSHVLYHQPKYLNTEIPEWIFIREVDANLYAGNSLRDAIYITFRNYGGRFGASLTRYQDRTNPGDFMTTAKNIFDSFGGVVGDFALLSKTLSGR